MSRLIRQLIAPAAAALAILIVMRKVVAQLWHGWPLVDIVSPYNLAILSFDYLHHGFIRRGLAGTIVALLGGGQDHAAAALLFFFLSAIWLAVPLVVLMRRLEARTPWSSLWPALVLVASPQLFWGWGQDLARADMLVEGFVAWAAIAALDRRYRVAAALLAAGALSHETALFYGVALVGAIWWIDQRAGRTTWRQGAAAVGVLAGLLVATALAQRWSGDPHGAVQAILRRYPGSTDAVYFTFGGTRSILVSICGSYLKPGFAFFLGGIFAILLCYVPVLLYRGPRSWLFFAMAALLPMTALSVVAIDYGRWLVFAVANAWIGHVVLRLREVEPTTASRRGYAVAGVLLAILMAMRSTAPMYPNMAIAEWAEHRLGRESGFAAERCDPTWRDVLAT